MFTIGEVYIYNPTVNVVWHAYDHTTSRDLEHGEKVVCSHAGEHAGEPDVIFITLDGRHVHIFQKEADEFGLVAQP